MFSVEIKVVLVAIRFILESPRPLILVPKGRLKDDVFTFRETPGNVAGE